MSINPVDEMKKYMKVLESIEETPELGLKINEKEKKKLPSICYETIELRYFVFLAFSCCVVYFNLIGHSLIVLSELPLAMNLSLPETLLILSEWPELIV